MTYNHPEYLVQTDWLAEHLQDDDLRILDVTAMLTSSLVNRAREACFDTGHIPGAVFFDVPAGHGVLSEKAAKLPWTWPDKKAFEQTMSDYGIGADTDVVIVARTPRPGIDAGTMWCTRAWWTMHHFGVRCAILAGGVEKWESEGRAMETSETVITPAGDPFVGRKDYARGRADKTDVLKSIGDGDVCLIDTLSAKSFAGLEPGYGPRKGHIAEAISVPSRALINAETALFKSADELKTALSESLERGKVITYCGGAIAATMGAFALKLLGHDQVAVYDGSLMEWSMDETLPMEDPNAD